MVTARASPCPHSEVEGRWVRESGRIHAVLEGRGTAVPGCCGGEHAHLRTMQGRELGGTELEVMVADVSDRKDRKSALSRVVSCLWAEKVCINPITHMVRTQETVRVADVYDWESDVSRERIEIRRACE